MRKWFRFYVLFRTFLGLVTLSPACGNMVDTTNGDEPEKQPHGGNGQPTDGDIDGNGVDDSSQQIVVGTDSSGRPTLLLSAELTTYNGDPNQSLGIYGACWGDGGRWETWETPIQMASPVDYDGNPGSAEMWGSTFDTGSFCRLTGATDLIGGGGIDYIYLDQVDQADSLFWIQEVWECGKWKRNICAGWDESGVAYRPADGCASMYVPPPGC